MTHDRLADVRGRPPTGRETIRFTWRITREEKALLQERANAAGHRFISAWLRQLTGLDPVPYGTGDDPSE